MKRAKVTFLGDVLDTGHRFFVKQKAVELGLKGYCRQSNANQIETEIEGSSKAVDEFLRFVEQGVSLQSESNHFTIELFDTLVGYKTMQSDII